eukprot:358866-Chlamydomonas_euryale.AAC.5
MPACRDENASLVPHALTYTLTEPAYPDLHLRKYTCPAPTSSPAITLRGPVRNQHSAGATRPAPSRVCAPMLTSQAVASFKFLESLQFELLPKYLFPCFPRPNA